MTIFRSGPYSASTRNPTSGLAVHPNLELALQEHARTREFPDKDAQAWSRIRDAYAHALREYDVRIAAPGQSVLELQNQLDPAFTKLSAEVIPHGFPVIEGLRPVTPKARKDGRLRLLILGRMQTGKGRQLLARALPGLVEHVQVYLLGTGKSGEAFFGINGVDVILEYKREELASILAEIGPDFAALLSVVPETFSFTLVRTAANACTGHRNPCRKLSEPDRARQNRLAG